MLLWGQCWAIIPECGMVGYGFTKNVKKPRVDVSRPASWGKVRNAIFQARPAGNGASNPSFNQTLQVILMEANVWETLAYTERPDWRSYLTHRVAKSTKKRLTCKAVSIRIITNTAMVILRNYYVCSFLEWLICWLAITLKRPKIQHFILT